MKITDLSRQEQVLLKVVRELPRGDLARLIQTAKIWRDATKAAEARVQD